MTNSIKAYIIKIQDKSFVAQWCNGYPPCLATGRYVVETFCSTQVCLCGLCLLSLSLCGLPLGTPASSHSPLCLLG